MNAAQIAFDRREYMRFGRGEGRRNEKENRTRRGFILRPEIVTPLTGPAPNSCCCSGDCFAARGATPPATTTATAIAVAIDSAADA